MDGPIVSLTLIRHHAQRAVKEGVPVDQACPWPSASVAAMRFHEEYSVFQAPEAAASARVQVIEINGSIYA